ncbi:MAG: ABC transporter permease subunit [Acidimicrobiales bacterium]
MEQLLGFAVPGIPYGCAYAIFAVGLVLTYQATGVFNFGYGAQAYVSAFLFAWMVEEHGVPVWLAFVVAVVLVGPGLGLVLDRLLFRRIPSTNHMAKVVTGLSLLVGIPSLLPVLFGRQNLVGVPSIAFDPDTVYFHLFGLADAPVNGIFLSAVIFTVAILAVLAVLLRATPLGLEMRAAVESRRLVQLEGINADRVVATAWAVSGLMAGLAGVLLAPTEATLQSQAFITLMVAAIAAAACAILRSMTVAAVVGVVIGVVSLVAQGYLPTSSIWYSAVLPALPFIVLFGALVLVPGLRSLDDSRDPMASVDPPRPPVAAAVRSPQLDRLVRPLWWLLLAAFVVSMLTWMPRGWETVLNQGLVYGTIFLSITLITGLGGQLSLAQGTLAGVAAFTAGQLAAHLGLNFLAGGVVGAAVAAAVAAVLALTSLRLRGLGLSLMTLAAALLFDNAVFSQTAISGGTGGLTVHRSWLGAIDFFDPSGHQFFVLALLVLAACTLAVLQVQRGTVGRYLAAMRGSETGAAGIGIDLSWYRVLVFALSGAVAGVGGTLLAVQQASIAPGQFNYQLSLAFVVIVLTTGVGTVEGAIQAAFGFVVLQELLQYAPQRFSGITFVVFAFGALTYAAHPEGVLEVQKRRWTGRFERVVLRQSPPAAVMVGPGLGDPGPGDPATGERR